MDIYWMIDAAMYPQLCYEIVGLRFANPTYGVEGTVPEGTVPFNPYYNKRSGLIDALGRTA